MKRTILMAALAAAAPLCSAQVSTPPSAPGTVTPGSSLGSPASPLGQPAIPSTGSFNRPGDTTLPGTPTTPGLSTLPGIGAPRDPLDPLDRNSSTGSSSLGSSPSPTFRSPSPMNCIPGSITNPC